MSIATRLRPRMQAAVPLLDPALAATMHMMSICSMQEFGHVPKDTRRAGSGVGKSGWRLWSPTMPGWDVRRIGAVRVVPSPGMI